MYLSRTFLCISKNKLLDTYGIIWYTWQVVGVGVGYIGKNNTTTGCAACSLKLDAWSLWIEEEEGLEAWRLPLLTTSVWAKLPDCNLYRLTNNLTPDPLPRTRVLRIMDQGSSLAKLDDPCFTASYTNLTPDPLAWDLPYFATMDQGSSLELF